MLIDIFTSLRARSAERSCGFAVGVVLALILLGAWEWWLGSAERVIVAVSVQASVESVAVAVPVTTLIEGRVGETHRELDQQTRSRGSDTGTARFGE